MQVERTLTLAADAERVWDTVICGDWLGDDGLIEPRAGADGWIRDGATLRHLVVEDVQEGRRLVFRWWPISPDGVGASSRVDIAVDADAEAHAEQTRVVVVEAPLVSGTPVPDSGPRAMAMI